MKLSWSVSCHVWVHASLCVCVCVCVCVCARARARQCQRDRSEWVYACVRVGVWEAVIWCMGVGVKVVRIVIVLASI